MDKKKIFKIISLVVLVIVIAFIANLARKTYIMMAYMKKCEEYSTITNFYRKMEQEGATTEVWRKGDEFLYKRTDQAGERMIYKGKTEDWIITNLVGKNNQRTKVASKLEKDKSISFAPSLAVEPIGETDIWGAAMIALISKVTSENVNGVECYKMDLGDDYEIYANKENFLNVKVTNGNIKTDKIEYKLNAVTDEDIKLPDLAGHKINK